MEEQLVKSKAELQKRLQSGASLENLVIQDLDLRDFKYDWKQVQFEAVVFLGCVFNIEDETVLRSRGAIIYPRANGIPYNPYRRQLYTWQELMEGHEKGFAHTRDYKIYQHFSETRYRPTIHEALNQRIHDHAIDDALRSLLGYEGDGMTTRRCVAIMGGHGVLRTDPIYRRAARLAQLLGENGYLVVSGGGPGIMEAANLGAWMAGYGEVELDQALELMHHAPHYRSEGYIDAALEALAAFDEGVESLAIPTWFYGHEPSNLFATHIAKYFSNSLREDTLLAIALYGTIFAPGSAGTVQEIFQDAAQNHYGTFGYFSPMVFLGREHYEIRSSIFPLLKQLSWGRDYHRFLHISDEPEDILRFIQASPPERVTSGP